MLRPDLGLAIELGTNRERIGSSKELYKSSDFSTPGPGPSECGPRKAGTARAHPPADFTFQLPQIRVSNSDLTSYPSNGLIRTPRPVAPTGRRATSTPRRRIRWPESWKVALR